MQINEIILRALGRLFVGGLLVAGLFLIKVIWW